MSLSCFGSAGRHLAALAAAAVLSACSLPNRGGPLPPNNAVSEAPDTKSAAQNSDLAYVVGLSHIYVFTFPGGKFVDESKYGGYAACADNRGNVYVTEAKTIAVYAHGKIAPSRSLPLDYQSYECAVDQTTGDLMVLSIAGIYEFKKGQGKPHLEPRVDFAANSCGYDNKGNLFVDGYYGNYFNFAELPNGGTKFKHINVKPGVIKLGGQVQWDGHYITIEDDGGYGEADVYRLSISGTHSTIEGTTHFTEPGMVPLWSWIAGGDIIIPYSIGETDHHPAIGFWRYPAGGKPRATRTKHFGYDTGYLYSAAVSVAP